MKIAIFSFELFLSPEKVYPAAFVSLLMKDLEKSSPAPFCYLFYLLVILLFHLFVLIDQLDPF